MSRYKGAASFKLKLANINKVIDYSSKAVNPTAQDILKHIIIHGFIPFKDGDLETDHVVVDYGGGKSRIVVKNTKYAVRLYFHPEFKFKRTINKHARGLWFEPYLSGGSQHKVPLDFMRIELNLILGKKFRGIKLYRRRNAK